MHNYRVQKQFLNNFALFVIIDSGYRKLGACINYFIHKPIARALLSNRYTTGYVRIPP